MLRAEPRPGLGLALQRRVARAHDALADVVDAVGRVVRDLVRELDAGVALLEVLDEVGLYLVSLGHASMLRVRVVTYKAVQLVEHGDHVAWPIGRAVKVEREGFGEVRVGFVVGE